MFASLIGRVKRPKVFCVGANKTGTTTLETTLKQLGYRMPVQREFLELIDDWGKRDFSRYIRKVKAHDAFQDVPFSLPFTYAVMDHEFPGSKFILSVRDDAEQWYESLVRFHAKLFNTGGRTPTRKDLEEATFIYKGRADHTNRLVFGTPHEEPYHKETLMTFYENHNAQVREYFRHRPDDLLEINVSRDEDYLRLCAFLGKEPMSEGFPWENKS